MGVTPLMGGVTRGNGRELEEEERKKTFFGGKKQQMTIIHLSFTELTLENPMLGVGIWPRSCRLKTAREKNNNNE